MEALLDGEFLKDILTLLGTPEFLFEKADPLAVFFVFLFSSRIFVFLLSVAVWTMVVIVRAYVSGNPNERSRKKMNKMGGFSIHQYHAPSDMMGMGSKPKNTTFLAAAIKGFALPVLVIFIAITIAAEMAYG